jgi:DNA-binding HxlR family transcriptional regulator
MNTPLPHETASALDECIILREILARLGDRWTLPVLNQIGAHRIRFNELHRAIAGISQRMLSVTLRNLERDGLMTRTVYPTVPAWVEYETSDLGRSLIGSLDSLTQWVNAHQALIVVARRNYDTMAKRGPVSPF